MMPEPSETEAVAESGGDLDRLASSALVVRLIEAQRGVADVVLGQAHAIDGVVTEIVERIERGGRLHYVGAGTSGRLATLDATEMPPTFGTEPDLVCAHMAGGSAALVRSVEGAEDDGAAGAASMRDVGRDDAVVGISAAGGAAYVIQAIATARERGAFTVAVVNNDGTALARAAERTILIRTGSEPLAGSTRLRAGTAQKIVLNTISTAVMVLLGRVYQNLMVDLVATNEKLRARALRIVERVTGTDTPHAAALLESARGSVKVAIAMARTGCSAGEARELLERNGGRLGDALSR